jgi:hypothetical protein
MSSLPTLLTDEEIAWVGYKHEVMTRAGMSVWRLRSSNLMTSKQKR